MAALETIQLSSNGPQPQSKAERVAIRSGVFNLANTILGAGMLGLPAAFARCGMVTGLLLLLVFGGLSALGLYLLSAACDIVGRPANFVTVSERVRSLCLECSRLPSPCVHTTMHADVLVLSSRDALQAAPGASLLLGGAIAIKCFGVATSYLIIVGDVMPQVLLSFGWPRGSPFLERRLWSLIAALCVSPLAFLRSLHALRHVSLVAISCVLSIVVLIILFSVRPPLSPSLDPCPNVSSAPAAGLEEDDALAAAADASAACRGPVHAFGGSVDTLMALPTFIFAYTCHQNIPALTNELRAASAASGVRGGGASGRGELSIILRAEAIAGCVYVAVAACGYGTFGARVRGDILTSYPTSPLLATARLAIATVVSLSYPLLSHPARACIIAILDALHTRRQRRAHTAHESAPCAVRPMETASVDADASRGASAAAGLPALPRTHHRRERRQFQLVTTCFLLLSTLIACAVDDLSLILSLVGATGSTIVSYLLPGLCYWRLCADPRAPLRRAALFLLVFGVAVMVLSLTLIVVKRTGTHGG